MRTVKIQGGLGNQLFGIAFAHSIHTLTGDPVALDLASYGADRYGQGFVFHDLIARLGGLSTTRRPWLASRAATALAKRLPAPGFVSEGRPPATPEALRRLTARAGYFSGYWQDEAFLAAPDEFAAAVRADVLARAEPVDPQAVVIHYRTYKEEINAARRAVPETAYFRGCIAALRERGTAPSAVTLISDDPRRAAASIGDVGVPILPLSSGSPWHDMATLLRARALILTNSSFSWWGGYGGDAEQIYYPQRGGLFHYPNPAARFTVLRT